MYSEKQEKNLQEMKDRKRCSCGKLGKCSTTFNSKICVCNRPLSDSWCYSYNCTHNKTVNKTMTVEMFEKYFEIGNLNG